jgi:hypothetical protein
MSVSKYFCLVVGEKFEKAQRFHPTSIKRLNAFALAIHIPVLLWAVTGYVISTSIFKLDTLLAVCISFFCAMAIYLVERIVLATPKNWVVNVLRVIIGLVIAILGASTVDLVIFDREISEQLQASAQEKIQQDFEKQAAPLVANIAKKKADWLDAQEAANCEANGTCGSRMRSVGPVYRELARQAATLRKDYLTEQKKFEDLSNKTEQQLDALQHSNESVTAAGLLSRIKALHEYTSNNFAALMAWLLFLVLVVLFELIVVISKFAFGETVDDRLDTIREEISQQKAMDYKAAITSPSYEARALINSTLAY